MSPAMIGETLSYLRPAVVSLGLLTADFQA
jgi:hypothetical protein